MSEVDKKIRFVQIIALLFVCGLFAADYGFDAMAKPPPKWAYIVPGLLGLGLEPNALRRLIVQIVKAMAGVPPEDRK